MQSEFKGMPGYHHINKRNYKLIDMRSGEAVDTRGENWQRIVFPRSRLCVTIVIDFLTSCNCYGTMAKVCGVSGCWGIAMMKWLADPWSLYWYVSSSLI